MSNTQINKQTTILEKDADIPVFIHSFTFRDELKMDNALAVKKIAVNYISEFRELFETAP
jgi:hypothetical protein